ncbi:MAG: hypothetical protein M1830_001710 [Pleopsidium flavum]|nr:MAG: hypothetical protein M1830_001710 [Pleopsidium flavum]
MTISQKIEQSITSRPSSLVPGYTLQRLLGLASRPEDEMFTLNMAMHYGQGILVGGVRGIMSLWGIRGPMADFMFTGLRILTDQTLENWTGVGALPWTWPVQEQVIDIIHKAIYAYTTGYVMDNFVH